jgi:hypothetical protein
MRHGVESAILGGALVLLAGMAEAGSQARPDVSLRYSTLLGLRGWQASLTWQGHGPVSGILDAGGYYFNGDQSVYAVMGGPRFITGRAESPVRLSLHLLAGVAFDPGLHGAVLVAHPGVGIDVGGDHPVTFRAQVEGPILLNVLFAVPSARFSAGIVLRPR